MLKLSATGKEFGLFGFDGVENCMQVSFALDWKDSWWRSDIWERCCGVLEMSSDDSQEKAEPAVDSHDVLLAVNGDHDAFGRIIDKYQRTIADQMRRFSRQPRIRELLQPLFESIFSAIEVHEEATFDSFVGKTIGFERLHLVWIRGHRFWYNPWM